MLIVGFRGAISATRLQLDDRCAPNMRPDEYFTGEPWTGAPGLTETVAALHSYIMDQRITIPFYDLAVFPRKEDGFFKAFSQKESAFFEQ